MKVLMVNGSPHEEGCTYTALGEVAKALEKAGVETEIMWLGVDAIAGCIGCGACAKTGKGCFRGDVVNEFIEKAKEADGFIFGTPIAYNNHKPFVLIRKKGKLPRETVSATYDLEYGSATIEMHKDSIKPGQKVLIVDDLIATGGTTEAMIKLIESLGGEVAGVVVLIELAGLKGRERINKYRLESAICYEGK